MVYYKFVLILLLVLPLQNTVAVELHAFQSILNMMGLGNLLNSSKWKDVANMTLEELGQSRGECLYDFMDHVTHHELVSCARDDHYIEHLLPPRTGEGARKAHIMVKCIPAPPLIVNDTVQNSTLQIIHSVKDVITLLKPIGNSTKRNEPGSCVLLYFYAETSLICAHGAPHANQLPHVFPKLRMAAVDAHKFPNFNTEFGVVGLPTLMLFHQGRPVVKFYSDSGDFINFVTRHTGMKPIDPLPNITEITGPLPLEPTSGTDLNLLLAWSFILLCAGNSFSKSRFFLYVVDMIKRNWRDTEARLDNN
ncbi:uncharacterized protein LOC119674161 [Teleopsis dalmanni]|uniref:uncharacterized protein LOC119674161 n=1 Tax=Teleopsis dalmanni TaxID=139649 RepID=UPI0018CE3AA6|nr:uncharacterized protein LOC119674161 [Teleopsis dalmanni]